MHPGSTVALLVLIASAAAAQDPPPLPSQVQPGARIRASATGVGAVTGTVIAMQGDSLDLARDRSADTVRLAANQLTSLELSVGRHKRRWTGAGIGFLGGAAIGALIGRASYQPSNCTEFLCDLGPEPAEIVGAVIVGGFGAIVGAGIGAGTADDWKPLAPDGRTSLGLRALPASRRVAIGASLRF